MATCPKCGTIYMKCRCPEGARCPKCEGGKNHDHTPSKSDMLTNTFTFKYGKGYSGVLVGQCKEKPWLIVQGDDLPDLLEDCAEALRAYKSAFGEEDG